MYTKVTIEIKKYSNFVLHKLTFKNFNTKMSKLMYFIIQILFLHHSVVIKYTTRVNDKLFSLL